MSKTGTYRCIDGKWIKVSDKLPRLADAYVPSGGYMDDNLGSYDEKKQSWRPVYIESKEQKASLLRERGLVEDGGFKPVQRRKYFNA